MWSLCCGTNGPTPRGCIPDPQPVGHGTGEPAVLGITARATLASAVLAYRVNVCLVARRLKRDVGTDRALGSRCGRRPRWLPPAGARSRASVEGLACRT